MMNIEQLYNDFCNLNQERNVVYGRGVVDINEHLPTLREYSSKSEHVTEMGTRGAVSTVALLIGKPKKVVSIDLNHHFFAKYEAEIREFANVCGTEFEFIVGDVLDMEIEETDFLFIDTFHTYNQLTAELKKHSGKVRKWIAFHDTVTFGRVDEAAYNDGKISDKVSRLSLKTGLYTALEDFLLNNPEWSIDKHFTNNNGLTIIKRA
jgi:cephalosporin hydroxylase